MSGSRPLCVLIGALGGEGGGVLANWLVDAAEHAGLRAQMTSVPGVAQRTGATTYYLEIQPRPVESRTAEPVMALLPSPGGVDLVVASELLEAGRAAQNGMITPSRTTVIASTHRFFAIAEKSAMGDGRFETERILDTVREMAAHAVLTDFKAVAEENATLMSSVLLGAIAAAGVLSIGQDELRRAIERSGISVKENLKGFAAGLTAAGASLQADTRIDNSISQALPVETGPILEQFSPSLREVLALGSERVRAYQDVAYLDLYLDRAWKVFTAEGAEQTLVNFPVTHEVVRHLALWMTYEDIIQVASLKTHPERLAKVRKEVRAADDQPVMVTEYLKPGLDEWCSVLPPGWAKRFRTLVERLHLTQRLSIGMHIKTSTVTGFLLMRALVGLRRWRRKMSRFIDEQARIERWLICLCDLLPQHPSLAFEVAQCPTLLKGYGDTHRRGTRNFEVIMDCVEQCASLGNGAEVLKNLRTAALADPQGDALDKAVAAIGVAL